MSKKIIAKISQKENESVVGRIGGNIPKIFNDKANEIAGYNFYISFQIPENRQEYISILVPQNYDEMLKDNIYPNCAIKAFTHSFSEESENDEYTLHGVIKSFITGYDETDSEQFDFITFSETPNLIQDEEYYQKKLAQDKYKFYCQIDEDYYPDDLNLENYIFGYGSLYLYKSTITGSIIAGFWQYS